MDPAQAIAAIEFGRFRVLPHRRELLAEGRPLELGGRAFDVLMALIEASGAVVSKDVLMNRVWPNRVVEENSLQAQISTLRRAFGADRDLIRTVAGRGYQFTGEVRSVSPQAIAGMPQPPPCPPTNLPEPVSELIGRDAEVVEIVDLSASHRLVTLSGAGGIGKTRLGFEAAQHLLPSFADGVWAIELAPLSDPELVPVTVATALGLELASGTASALSVANALRSKQLMLVLDNCEHVVDAAAQMAESLLHANPAARVIATSREPLRVEGEWVYPVPPLAVPTEDSLDSEDALRYGAVQLFVERARAAEPHFSPDACVLAAIAGICRRLDGIPLAIELAAARAAALGIGELAARLDDRFQLLTGGRRTALPRHQTLRATLDWSYELLAEPERVILRRLGVFAGAFGLEGAAAVAAISKISPSEVVDGLFNLVSKSLVSTEEGAVLRYRLLDTMRAYGLQKLAESGELEAVARRHAEYYRDLFERAETETEVRPATEWLADYGRRIDNLRAALDWAFSPGGDASIGTALTAAAVPLWMQLSLLEECRGRVERALAALNTMATPNPRREMLLRVALANAVLGTAGTVDAVGSAWNRALELAEELDDIDQQLRALYGLYLYQMRIGKFREGVAFARRFRTAAEKKSDPSDLLLGNRIVGVSLFLWLGDAGEARVEIERLLARSPALGPQLQAVRFGLDQRVAALFHLSRILWVQGYPDQAVRTAAAGVDEAVAIDHTISLCFALADGACPVSAWVGDRAATARFVGMLSARAEKLGLAIWHAYGLAWRGWLADREGDSETAIALFDAAIGEFRATQFDLHFTTFLGSFAEILTRADRVADGAAAIDEAIRRAELTEERWCFPELLRIRGDVTWHLGRPEAAQLATDLYMRALDLARRQGALSWELRAATSLAALLSDQGRWVDALALLQPVYDQFTEGFDTADLRAAKALLNALY